MTALFVETRENRIAKWRVDISPGYQWAKPQDAWVSGYSVQQGRERGWVSAGQRGPCIIGKEQAKQHHDTL